VSDGIVARNAQITYFTSHIRFPTPPNPPPNPKRDRSDRLARFFFLPPPVLWWGGRWTGDLPQFCGGGWTPVELTLKKKNKKEKRKGTPTLGRTIFERPMFAKNGINNNNKLQRRNNLCLHHNYIRLHLSISEGSPIVTHY
jgi:hypothetical protein